MDLNKLISELRTYRSQVQEAIGAMEALALRRGAPHRRVKRTARRAAGKRLRPMLVKATPVKATPVKRKRRRAARRNRAR